MILEIIVGTDLLLEHTTYSELEKFLADCMDYLDVDTFEFLNCMLFSKVNFHPGYFMSEHLEKEPHLIAENIRAMDTAIKENITFQAIGESFSNRLPSRRAELLEMFDFEDMDLNRTSDGEEVVWNYLIKITEFVNLFLPLKNIFDKHKHKLIII